MLVNTRNAVVTAADPFGRTPEDLEGLVEKWVKGDHVRAGANRVGDGYVLNWGWSPAY